MPEGDTLHRVARQITDQLCGKRIEASRGRPELPKAQELAGCILQTAEARGKHLLLGLDNGFTVHSHLGMTGSWHILPPRRALAKTRLPCRARHALSQP